MDPSPEQLELADKMAELPLRFCEPVIIGRHIDVVGEELADVTCGSATLLRIGSRSFLITNAHVINEYRKRRREIEGTIFQVAQAVFNPDGRLVCESGSIDIAVIDVDGLLIKRDATHDIPTLEPFTPTTWPPQPEIKAGDVIFFGAWPGGFRSEGDGGRQLNHQALSYIGIPITDIGENHFYCAFDRSKFHRGAGPPDDRDFPGMSGGPIFRDEQTGRVEGFSLVGFIDEDIIFTCEDNSKRDTLRAVKSSLLLSDGTLRI